MDHSFVVGIAGGSCSGKTTFAHRLVEAIAPIECGLINMDHYYRHGEGPAITLSDGEVFADYNHPDSTDHARAVQDLVGLTQPVVVIEGLMVLHLPSIRDRLDLKIFVDTDAPTRAVRRMIRAKERSPEKSLEWAGRYYLDCAVPGHEAYVHPSKRHADFTVSGNGDNLRSVEFIGDAIRQSLIRDRRDRACP